LPCSECVSVDVRPEVARLMRRLGAALVGDGRQRGRSIDVVMIHEMDGWRCRHPARRGVVVTVTVTYKESPRRV